MCNAEELKEVLLSLKSADADERAAVLLVLADDPTRDDEIRVAVEGLIDDRTVCRAQPPAVLTEVRWYAAHALAAERGAAGISTRTSVCGVVPPIELGMLAEIEEGSYGRNMSDISLRERFEKLRADELLPTTDLRL